MTDIKFRQANVSDLSELNKISYQAKAHWGYPREWMDHWREELLLSKKDLENESITLLELDKEIAGFCSVKDGSSEAEVTHLWLLLQYIGKGFGALLLGKALESLPLEKPVKVVADPNAEPFYKNQGFRTVGQVESFPRGRFLPVMERRRKFAFK